LLQIETSFSDTRKVLRLLKWATTGGKAISVVRNGEASLQNALEVSRLTSLTLYFLLDNVALMARFMNSKKAKHLAKVAAVFWAISGIASVVGLLRSLYLVKKEGEKTKILVDILSSICDVRLALTGAGVLETTRHMQGVLGTFSSAAGLKNLYNSTAASP